ncbi:hypothetical protein B0T14DRAFT_509236 [Immersiella caudata]|uniref:Uncharacterized protein n=1 Tax=Immersiella caudata TaxID=314043 RepID=A0AA40C5F5_9PEZI|nr:hypothetical protein B0T14DRAFT_509236 [Immersiella caudata]
MGRGTGRVRWGGRTKTLRGGCQCKPSLCSREEIAEQQVTAESKGYVRYRQCRPCKADTKSSDRGDGASRYKPERPGGFSLALCICCSWGSVSRPGAGPANRPFWEAVLKTGGNIGRAGRLVTQSDLVHPKACWVLCGIVPACCNRVQATLAHTPQADGAEESGNLRLSSYSEIFRNVKMATQPERWLEATSAATIGRCGSGSGGYALVSTVISMRLRSPSAPRVQRP